MKASGMCTINTKSNIHILQLLVKKTKCYRFGDKFVVPNRNNITLNNYYVNSCTIFLDIIDNIAYYDNVVKYVSKYYLVQMKNPKNQSGPMVCNSITLVCPENKSVTSFYLFCITWNFE
jgi:hypothetical protein